MSDQNRDTADNGENPEPESDGGRDQRREEEVEADVGGQSDEPESNSSASQGQVAEAVCESQAPSSDQPEDFSSLGCQRQIFAAISPSDHGPLPEGHSEGEIDRSDDDLSSLSQNELEYCTNDQTEDSVPVHEVYREGGFGMSSAEDITDSGSLQAEAERAEDDMFTESALERMSTDDIEDSIKTSTTLVDEQEDPEDDVISETWNRNSNSYSVEETSTSSAVPNLAPAETQGTFGVPIDVQLEELLQVNDGLNQPEMKNTNSQEPTSKKAAQSCSGELNSATTERPEGQNIDTLSESDLEQNASRKTSEETAESCSGELYSTTAESPEGQNTDTLSESDLEQNASRKTSEETAESCSGELYSTTAESPEGQNTDTLSESDLEQNASRKTSEETAESCSGELYSTTAESPEGQNTDSLSESDPEENASGTIVCNEDVEADCSQDCVQVNNLGHRDLQGDMVENQPGILRLNGNAECRLVADCNVHLIGTESSASLDSVEASCSSSNRLERVSIVEGGQLGDVGNEDVLVSEPGDEPEDSGSCHVINSLQLASSSETDLYAPECDRRQADANSPSEISVAEPTDFENRADNKCLEASNVQSNTPASEAQDPDSVNISSNRERVGSPPLATTTFMSDSEFQSFEVEHVPPCQLNSNLLEEVDLGPTRCTGISGSVLNDDILRSADLIQSLCENKDSISEDSTEMASVAVKTDLNSSCASNSVNSRVESATNTDISNSLDPSQRLHVMDASLCQTSKSNEQTVKKVHSSSEHSNSIACLENLPSVLCKDISAECPVNGSINHVTTSVEHLTADENLLDELDAELEPMSSTTSSITSLNSSSSSTIIEDKFPCVSQPINGLKVKPVLALCELTDEKIQEILADFQKQISEKDSTITRLESDKALQSEKLEYTLYERDSYLKQLQATKSKQQAHDLYLPQIKELEYTIAQYQTEIRSYKEKLSSHDAAAKRTVGALQNELKVRVDQVTKTYEDCRKEKDSMVIKYAQAEHKNIELQKATEKSEGRLRDIFREREIFLTKAKQLKADYQRTCSELETKTIELSAITKELDKHKELVTSSEVRIKWAQNKLKAELDAHKETKKELDKSVIKIKESKEETAQIRRDCQAIIKTYQESEEMKSSTLDVRLKKKESELLLEKQEKTDQSEVFHSVQKELDTLKFQYKDNLEELKTYKDKVRAQEAERLTNEDTMTKYKDIIQTQKRENREHQAKIDKLFHFQSDFDRAQDMIKSLDADIRDLKLTNKEIQTEIENCRRRESDLLNLTRNLTEKNAHLQSENTTLSGQVMNLISDTQKKDMDLQEFETKLKDVSDKLDEEVKGRKSETTSLAENLNSKSQTNEDLTRTVDEQKDEIKTLKRRHASNIKDLTRQLQQARRKLESADAKGDNKETVSMGSRTSSNGSLNTPSADMNGGQSTTVPPRALQAESPPQEYPVIVEQVEIDREVLINRIVRLQKAHARKNEKIEFMEDHINQLLAEVKKKKRIIQHYVMREETGALSTENMDINKAELSKRGGIMASVYSSHASDSHMTLDLSLEINRKLQSVLEDTLLKNITLKENIDTLGEEIARLSQENRRIQLTLQGL